MTCFLTIDNKIENIYYNNDQLGVFGDVNDWKKAKIIKFHSCNKNDPGKLTIQGKDNESNNQNCDTGGLFLYCTASDKSSYWEGFKSDESHWKDGKNQKPCHRQSGPFFNQGVNWINTGKEMNVKKIWAPRQQVTLIGDPASGMYNETFTLFIIIV